MLKSQYVYCSTLIFLAFLSSVSLTSSKELPLISEQETQLILTQPDQLPQTFFLLLCYQKDIKCEEADNEVMLALNELKSLRYSFESIINNEFAFRRVECITDYQRNLCQVLGHQHHLKPARIQIIPSSKIVQNTPKGVNQVAINEKEDMSLTVYKFTSPLQSEYIRKKIMMFTIPSPVIPYDNEIDKIQDLDDIKSEKNVIYALVSEDENLIQQYQEVAAQYKERFYFINIKNQSANSTKKSEFYAIGFNFSRSIDISYNDKDKGASKKLMEDTVLEWQFQDLLIWDYESHIENKTYLESLKGKLIVVGLAGKITNYLTTDFLFDFRKLAQHYRYSLNKYEFAVIDIDDEKMFYFLTSFYLGRFDSPGIFVIEDIEQKKYYRNYEIYNGRRNFANISDELISQINKHEKSPLYAYWKDCYQNFKNFEHWNNNRLKAYMYFLGTLSLALLPIALLVDCFFPLFGRGPHAKSRHDKKEEDKNGKQNVQEAAEKAKITEKTLKYE